MNAVFGRITNEAPNKLSVIIDGETYDAMKSTLGRDVKYSELGVQEGYEFSIILQLSDLDTAPEMDDLITVGGVEYRVMGSEVDSTDISIRIDLGRKFG